MIIEIRCDICGKAVNRGQMSSDEEGDFCESCAFDRTLSVLKERYATKKKWLEDTHLKDLQVLEQQIAEMERWKV